MNESILSNTALDRLADTVAEPIVVEGKTIKNPNDVDDWIVATLKSKGDQKLGLFLEALSFSQSQPVEFRQEFSESILRNIGEEYGSVADFIKDILDTDRQDLQQNLLNVLEKLNLVSQLSAEQLQKLSDAVREQLPEKPEPEEVLASAEVEKKILTLDDIVEIVALAKSEQRDLKDDEVSIFQSSLEVALKEISTMKPMRVYSFLSGLMTLVNVDEDGLPKLTAFKTELATKIANSAEEICKAEAGDFDPKEDNFLVDCSDLMSQLFGPVLKQLPVAQQQTVIQILNIHLDKIKENFLYRNNNYQNEVRFIAQLSDEGQRKATALYVENSQRDFDKSMYAFDDFFSLEQEASPTDRTISEAVMKQVVFYGNEAAYVDIQELLPSFELVGDTDFTDNRSHDLQMNIRHNLSLIHELEGKAPGATKYFLKERGIHHFTDFSLDFLAQQYAEKDQVPKNGYVVIFVPNADYNRGFKLSNKWDELLQQANEQGVALKVAEIASKTQFIGRLNQFTREYGQASGAFFGAHGWSDGMLWGDGAKADLSVDDLKDHSDLARKALKKFFKKNSIIALSSCLTGSDDGLAAKLSEVGTTVIGPSDETSPKSFSVNRQGKEIVIDMEYNDDVKRVFKPKKTFDRFRKFFG